MPTVRCMRTRISGTFNGERYRLERGQVYDLSPELIAHIRKGHKPHWPNVQEVDDVERTGVSQHVVPDDEDLRPKTTAMPRSKSKRRGLMNTEAELPASTSEEDPNDGA